MNRLTQRNEQGRWSLKGFSWDELHGGAVISPRLAEALYGALCKLKDYEDTGLSPEDVEQLDDFEKTNTEKLLQKLAAEKYKHRWIPVEEKLPEDNNYILLSFANFSLPMVGRYERDSEGGAFYLGDDDDIDDIEDVFREIKRLGGDYEFVEDGSPDVEYEWQFS